ncbi:hypothetical protein [uncultured Rhodoblastus sp.]|uniref:DUF6927 domain-containing protein n=1 Tax=uncultured Rhodoblastus sp. TaxID=543037 RepID=UPI0025F5FDCF|nr:hypothetical protein [uncultured Rhodoblastus sp.]
MGWTFEYEKLTKESPAQRIARDLTFETETHKSTAVATATVGKVVYAAVRREIKNSATSYFFCAVVLFKNSEKDGFGTKFMDETAGPCEIDCPERIFKLLSSVAEIPDSSYAADWRARVEAARKTRNDVRSMSPGDIVRLSHPVNFAKGPSDIDAFRFIERVGRTPIFAPLTQPNFRCRLTRYALDGATVEKPQPAIASDARPGAREPARVSL